MRLQRALVALFALLLPTLAWGQGAILQGGPWVPGHIPVYVGTGAQPIIQDSGLALGTPLAVIIAGGTINGTTIGQTVPAAVAATDLKAATGAFATVAGSTSAPHGIDFTMSAGVPQSDQSVGPHWSVTNSSANPGLGQVHFYFSNNTTGPNFDLGDQEVMFDRGTIASGNTTVPNYQTHWLVHVAPYNTTASYTAVNEEVNMVNRSNDVGYQPDVTATAQLTGGIRFIPESNTFGDPGTGHNVTFGFHAGHSSAVNTLGKFVKTYNPFGIEYDGIGPGGVGFLAEGGRDGLTGDDPLSPLAVLGRFSRGIDFTGATLADSTPLRMNQGQFVGWTNGTGTATMQGSCSGATCNIVTTASAVMPFGVGDLGSVSNPWANFYTTTASVTSRLTIPFGTPATSTSNCIQGQVQFDATYIYTCIATNTWHRVANGATW